jgi:murein DD-endopeptidase MepM/ murein hydrolase activator NlpD
MKKRRRPRKTLSSWLTSRYLLIVRKEDNFAEKSTFSFTYAKLVVFIFSLFTVFFLISFYLVTTILAQWFDPRHAELEANKQMIELSFAVDSLADELRKKDLFLENLQRIMRGERVEAGINSGKKHTENNPSVRETNLKELQVVDSQFRKKFEESGLAVLTANAAAVKEELRDIFFFSPITGIITSAYNAKIEHFGVDIVAKDKEPVKSVLDGTIIFANWTQEFGNVIAIQHRGELISIYKHNSELLQKVGNFVHAGDVISIIGNTGEMTTGPHLHFELWYGGNPINPEEFVSF